MDYGPLWPMHEEHIKLPSKINEPVVYAHSSVE